MQEVNKEKLLERLAAGDDIRTACQKTGIGKSTFYRWKDSDPVFRAEITQLLQAQDLITAPPLSITEPEPGVQPKKVYSREPEEEPAIEPVAKTNSRGFIRWGQCRPEPRREKPVDILRRGLE